jgi:hypothetical protein
MGRGLRVLLVRPTPTSFELVTMGEQIRRNDDDECQADHHGVVGQVSQVGHQKEQNADRAKP